MRVSHEVPISFLQESQVFNDYDYCLLHLTYEREEYRSYYKNAVKQGREVLLDNSLFELGDALTLEQVAEGVRDINPTWVVVPDCLNEKDTTIQRFLEWESKYSNLNVGTIGVVQGKTLSEMIECYKFMSKHADKIAIPFDSKAFETLVAGGEATKTREELLEVWCQGRQYFVGYLICEGIWDNNKPHHLLGCSYAKEFSNMFYGRYIDTVDTSNPVVAAIKGLKYTMEGLTTKPSIMLCDLIDHQFTEEEKQLMLYNTTMFKYICGSRPKWIAFYSQTGSEIANLIKRGFYPHTIVTNKQDLSNMPDEFKLCTVVRLPDRPSVKDYLNLVFVPRNIQLDKAIITLHGYLRIIPEVVCNMYDTWNLHPGLITKYPELKGFNPQEKAYKLQLPEIGAVIHKVVPEVDSGEIVMESKAFSTGKLTLDDFYNILHREATEMWVDFLNRRFNN